MQKNTVKIILFDADGVAIKSREKLFSERFAEKQEISVSSMLPFFKEDMKLAFVDEVDIKESLEKYLSTWKWRGSVNDFLEYWFGEESPRDEEVLKYIQELRSNGVRCYIATDREKYWGEYLKENVGLKNDFDGFFYSYDVGYEKDKPEYFKEVARRLHLRPEEIMYFDDDQKNVDVAQEVGIYAKFYSSLKEMRKEISAVVN